MATLAYLGMLATTIVRDTGPPDLSGIDPRNRTTSEYELPEFLWLRARLRSSQGAQDDVDLNYGDRKPEFMQSMSKSSRYIRASRSVGRFQAKLPKNDNQEILIACTGVLISDTLVLTAAHCLKTDDTSGSSKRQSAAGTALQLGILQAGIRFGLFNDNSDGVEAAGSLFELEREPLEYRPELDFAVFRLKPAEVKKVADAGYLPAWLSAKPLAKNDDAFVIGHPLAGPLRLSRAGCRITWIDFDPTTHKFQHSCGTAPGVSGAPIFDDFGCVIGVHVEAPRSALIDAAAVGYGIPMREIAVKSQKIRVLIASGTSTGCGLPPT